MPEHHTQANYEFTYNWTEFTSDALENGSGSTRLWNWESGFMSGSSNNNNNSGFGSKIQNMFWSSFR
jgi:hypothetical protein